MSGECAYQSERGQDGELVSLLVLYAPPLITYTFITVPTGGTHGTGTRGQEWGRGIWRSDQTLPKENRKEKEGYDFPGIEE